MNCLSVSSYCAINIVLCICCSFVFAFLVMCRPSEVKNSSKSTADEYRGRNTSQPSNFVSQRQKQTPANRHLADTGTAAGGIHEEWETASESSDVLKDSDSQRQSQQSARGDRHAGSRQDSKRGYSNQRHTQSRRGRYRDRPAADVGTASVAADRGTGSSSSTVVDTQLSQTNSTSVATVDNSQRPNTFPSSDPNGPNGNIHPLYRVDRIVFDDPVAIQTAICDAFVRCVM